MNNEWWKTQPGVPNTPVQAPEYLKMVNKKGGPIDMLDLPLADPRRIVVDADTGAINFARKTSR